MSMVIDFVDLSRDQVFNGARCVRTIVDNRKTPHHPAGYIPPDDLQAVDRPASE